MERGRDFKNIVRLMHLSGESVRFIAHAKDTTVTEVLEILQEYDFIKKIPRQSSQILGSKQEPYQTEEEMLNPPVYLYDELSASEKKIYNESRESE